MEFRYPWGGTYTVADGCRVNRLLNSRCSRLLHGSLSGISVWVIGGGYSGNAEQLGLRLRASLPGAHIVGADGVAFSAAHAWAVLPGQVPPDQERTIYIDAGCDTTGLSSSMLKCWNIDGAVQSSVHRYSAIPITNALVEAGAARVYLAGFVPGFRTNKDRIGGRLFGDFWIPPEGMADLSEFDKLKGWAAERGSRVSLLAPLNISDSPWQGIGTAIAAEMKENKIKWHEIAKNTAN